jgi:hypothetical protein
VNIALYLRRATQVVHATRAVFNGGRTQSYEWRRDQLLGVIRFLEEERTAILAALKQDLNKASG